MSHHRRGGDRYREARGWRSRRGRCRRSGAHQRWDDDVRVERFAELVLEELASGEEECGLV
eukprot:8450146-Heterocapsa_arctica.AAC.1